MNEEEEPLLSSTSERSDVQSNSLKPLHAPFANQSSMEKYSPDFFYNSPGPRIAAFFSCSFHSKHGNVLDGVYPPLDFNVRGLEFHAIPSGVHNEDNDYIYFKQGQLFGVACVYKKRSESYARGSAVRSIGVLSTHFYDLRPLIPKLHAAAIEHIGSPCDGAEIYLKELYHYFLSTLPEGASHPSPNNVHHLDNAARETAQADNSQRQDLLATYTGPLSRTAFSLIIPSAESELHFRGAGSLLTLLRILGPNIMTLWKAVLLRSRILISTVPPIGPACAVVMTCCLLAEFARPIFSAQNDFALRMNPLFYVGLIDVDHLKHAKHFVACTTDTVMEMKDECWDVLVRYPTVSSAKPALEISPHLTPSLLTLTRTDESRYDSLVESLRAEASPLEYEKAILGRFRHYSEALLSEVFAVIQGSNPVYLHRAKMSSKRVEPVGTRLVTRDGLENFGLGPGDHLFLEALLLHLGTICAVEKPKKKLCFCC